MTVFRMMEEFDDFDEYGDLDIANTHDEPVGILATIICHMGLQLR